MAESDIQARSDQPANRQVAHHRALRPSAGSCVAVVLLAALAVAFVAVTWPRFTGPFGDSHDGRNAAVWATGSRALREEGPVSSRLGAVQEDGRTYANHPPLMMWTMAGSEALFGESPATARLPILVSTLAAIGLLYAVGREAGFDPLAVVLGVVAAFGSAMILSYGVMPDTPMFSLPFGLTVVLVWQRASSGRVVSPLLVVAAGFVASMSGWEAAALAVVAGSMLLVPGCLRHDRARRTSGFLLLGGAAAGTAITFGWAAWAYGSASILLEQLSRRSSDAEGATPAIALSNQLGWLVELFGPALLGMILALAAAVLDRRVRSLFVLLLGVTLGYTIVLRDGAAIHDYWSYWFSVPIGLGVAWGAQRLAHTLAGRVPRQLLMAVGTAAALAVLLIGIRHRPVAVETIERGFEPARAVERHERTGAETAVADIGRSAGFESWLAYDTRLPYRHLSSRSDLVRLADEHPHALLLLHRSCSEGSVGELCRSAWSTIDSRSDEPADARPAWQVMDALTLVQALPPVID